MKQVILEMILFQMPQKEECDAIKNKYHLPMDKKIVLYAPTWRDNSYVSAGYTF